MSTDTRYLRFKMDYEVVVPVRVPFIGQIKLFNHLLNMKSFVYKEMINVKLNFSYYIAIPEAIKSMQTNEWCRIE